MNSYNENLHSSIVSSLSDQELEMQKAKALRDASKFSLYYAQGATITASERLDQATTEYKHQQKVHKEAVIDSDFSTNVLSSAKSSKAFVDQSVSNTAVAAANVQIATNAIVKLASDIGSVYNIVKAGDYGTEIYDQSTYANQVMSRTAYLAEKTSETSMNTSASIAEVATTALEKKAEATDASIKSLLEAVHTNFVAKAEVVKADNEVLAQSNTTEKAAEGVLEQNNVNYNAVSDAYDLSNCELNLNLKVMIEKPKENDGRFMVSFDRYQSAFSEPKELKAKDPALIKELKNPYPVEDYYIMVVKYDKSTIFSIANAEGLILKDEKKDGKFRYKIVPPSKISPIQPIINLDLSWPGKPFTMAKNHFNEPLVLGDMLDSDEEPMEPGKNYVVFVFAKLMNNYKKLINTYDDYLTAPSKAFKLTTCLEAVNNNSIRVITGKKDNTEVVLAELVADIDIDNEIELEIKLSDKEKIAIKDGKLTFQNQFEASLEIDIDHKEEEKIEGVFDLGGKEVRDIDQGKPIVVFITPKDKNNSHAHQYRCMFLVNEPELTKNLLTVDELNQIQKITDEKDREVFKWAQEIRKILDKITKHELKIEKAKAELASIELLINDPDKKTTKNTENKRDKLIAELEKSIKELEAFRQALDEVLEKEKIEMEKLEGLDKVPDFYFDLEIAEKVPFGSYTVVDQKIDVFGLFDIWYFQIQSSTTDNFGNRLVSGYHYIPTVLTITDNEDVSKNKNFTNAMSKITDKGSFEYDPVSSKK